MRKRTQTLGTVDITIRATIDVDYIEGTCPYTDPDTVELNEIVEILDADTDTPIETLEDLKDLIADRATEGDIDWEE